jgi:hypothetical protein
LYKLDADPAPKVWDFGMFIVGMLLADPNTTNYTNFAAF